MKLFFSSKILLIFVICFFLHHTLCIFLFSNFYTVFSTFIVCAPFTHLLKTIIKLNEIKCYNVNFLFSIKSLELHLLA